MIELRNVTKRYRDKVAVSDLTVTIRPGLVTGFLGPNGAGKSTTMRMILGLDHPTAGEALVNGRRYADHAAPLREVGALLDARAFHPGRSGYAHLLALAATAGIGRRRIAQVLELVGLDTVANKRTRGFSQGMGQRLGLAAALLGDPATILLDEPVNGLDPTGIRWIRQLLRNLAAEGRTVFVSSHLMSEMALTADHLVIIGRGRLLADTSVAEMTSASIGVRVRTTDSHRLRGLIEGAEVTVTEPQPELLTITGRSSTEIAQLAQANGIVLSELTPLHASLEEAYLSMTQDAVEYHTDTADENTSQTTWRAA
jgi:ABC-2 type transport system ATP-binding protein